VLFRSGAALWGPIAAATTYAADPVLFQGAIPEPPAAAAALRSTSGARFTAKLHVINNSREPVILSAAAALTPELVDPRGEAVAVSSASKAGRAQPGRGGALAAGQSRTMDIAGRLRLAGGELRWQGDDGSAAAWKLVAGQRYSLRLRYQADDAGGWRGVGLTHAVALPNS
jgi:hypothetical protein